MGLSSSLHSLIDSSLDQNAGWLYASYKDKNIFLLIIFGNILTCYKLYFMDSKYAESILIGLTGGIASGKSTVIHYLLEKGYSVINADKLGHRVLDQGTSGFKKVVETFGKGILFPNGSVNRKELGRIVFSNPKNLLKLNQISHPLIAEMIEIEYQKLFFISKNKIIFLEAALLIEAGWNEVCGEIWVIAQKPDITMERLQNRDGLSKVDAVARIESQISQEERLTYADVVLKNDGLKEELLAQTYEELLKLKKRIN